MNPQIGILITAALALGAILFPERAMLVKLSQHPDLIVQLAGAAVSLATSFGLFIAKPHPSARAAVFGVAQRVRAWFVPRVFPPAT